MSTTPRMPHRFPVVLALLLGLAPLLASAPATAADAHANCPHAAKMRAATGALPASEPAPAAPGLESAGQAAFAALAEAVAVLEADPSTDWSRVDLERLREHLVDMDAVALGARVESEPIPGGLRLRVAGEGRARDALRRMVPSHSAMMQGYRGWQLAVRETAEGVALDWTAADPSEAARIRGLGFFGLLASGDHHRRHHLMLARGDASPHGMH